MTWQVIEADCVEANRALAEALERFAECVERDRREPDKLVIYAHQMRALAHKYREGVMP